MAGAAARSPPARRSPHERWYWAVGHRLVDLRQHRLARRDAGPRLPAGPRHRRGLVAGLGVAVPLHGEPAAAAVLVALCVFGIFYMAAVSYSWMIFFVTVLAGVLYGLLGTVDPACWRCVCRRPLAGALGAALAVLLVLPVTTHATTDAWIRRALRCVHALHRRGGRPARGFPDRRPRRRASPNWRRSWAAYGSPSRRSSTR